MEILSKKKLAIEPRKTPFTASGEYIQECIRDSRGSLRGVVKEMESIHKGEAILWHFPRWRKDCNITTRTLRNSFSQTIENSRTSSRNSGCNDPRHAFAIRSERFRSSGLWVVQAKAIATAKKMHRKGDNMAIRMLYGCAI